MVRCCSMAWRASEALRRGARKGRPAVQETSHSGVPYVVSKAAIFLTYYSGLRHPEPRHAPALKPTHKAGRCGGRALRVKCFIYFSSAKGNKNHLI